MSNKKLTGKDLERLIENVLSEEGLPVKWSGNELEKVEIDDEFREVPNEKSIKDKLGIELDKSSIKLGHISNYRKLMGVDNDYTNLTSNDLTKAFNAEKTNPSNKAARNLVASTDKDSIKKAVLQIYHGTDAGKESKALHDSIEKLKNSKTLEEKLKALEEFWVKDVSDKKRAVKKMFLNDGYFSQKERREVIYFNKKGSFPLGKAGSECYKEISRKVSKNEKAGTVDYNSWYTRYVTDSVDHENSLEYYKGNYNYTVFAPNEKGIIEPWFIGDSASNIKKFEALSKTEEGIEYLNHFSYKPGLSKIFINNLKFFKKAIEEKKMETNPNSKFGKWWEDMTNGYRNLTKVDQAVKGGLKRTSITNQPFMSQAAEKGEMLDSQFSMFKTFFEGTIMGDPMATMSSRIKKMTDFTKELYDVQDIQESVSFWNLGANKQGISATSNQYVDFLNKIQILDYFNTMAKELEYGSGAYIFEAFCAYLAGGVTAGKTKGIGGAMGEVDFYFEGGFRGSSKYLRSSNEFKQSLDHFIQGTTITYVFASKKGQKPVRDKTGTIKSYDSEEEIGQSNPDLIHFIDIYVVNVTRKEQRLDDGNTAIFDVADLQGTKTMNLSVRNGDVVFNVKDIEPIGRLYLVEKDKKSIMSKLESLGRKMDKDKETAQTQFETLVGHFKKTFMHLDNAREKVSEYSSTGKLEKGTEATSEIKSASTEFEGVFKIVNSQESGTLKESKQITAEHLKKLIQESFK